MSKISELISSQSFEIVRDRLGEILADEINNQFNVLSKVAELNAKVWIERFIPFDHTEMPAVNVMLAKGTYAGQTVVQADGTYTYNIDVYTKSDSDSDGYGDKRAMIHLHKLLGVIRSILNHPAYNTLGFVPPFVMSRQVKDITIADPSGRDAELVVMGRLTIEVKVPETYNLKQGALIAGYETTMTLDETDKGYFFKEAA